MQVRIKNPCKADGEYLMPGDTPDLGDNDAQALIESGAAEALQGGVRPDDADALLTEIREAIASLATDDGDAWTKSGKAKTEAIETVLGYAITAAERDAATADA